MPKINCPAKGRKGAWQVKNSARWDRKENKAREAAVVARAEFIHEFIYHSIIKVEDTTRVYAGGIVREFPGEYLFELQQSAESEVLGARAAGNFLVASTE